MIDAIIRLFRRIVAFFSFTFVADCPICHKHFYGFHKHGVQVKIRDVHYRIVCHRCVKDVTR
jgi:hypothetical protein